MSLLAFWTRRALQLRADEDFETNSKHWYITEWLSKGRTYRTGTRSALPACRVRESYVKLEIVDWIAGQDIPECATCRELRTASLPPERARYNVTAIKATPSPPSTPRSSFSIGSIVSKAGSGKTFPPPTIGKKKP